MRYRMVAVMFIAALLAAVILAEVGALSPASAQTNPKVLAACEKARKVLDATELPSRFDTEACPVKGRIIKDAGGIGSVLPPPGAGIYVESLTPAGTQELTINRSRNGAVEIEDAGTEDLATEPLSGEVTTLGTKTACSDRANAIGGYRVYPGLKYFFNTRTTPRGITRRAATSAVRRAETSLSRSRNTCRMGDKVPVRTSYSGNTRAKASVGSKGNCLRPDRKNVVSFGRLPKGNIGRSCTWFVSQGGNIGKVTDFDIMFDKFSTKWTSRPGESSCKKRGLYDLQSTATHEFGHVYGLYHPSGEHPSLTMNWSGSTCDASARTLGRGDVLGLGRIY